jgi:hypothetical protein
LNCIPAARIQQNLEIKNFFMVDCNFVGIIGEKTTYNQLFAAKSIG